MLDPKFSQAKEVNVRLGVMYKWKGEFAASLEVRKNQCSSHFCLVRFP